MIDRALRSSPWTGTASIERDEGGLRYFINAFWTSGQRQAHSLHEISYRACFKPQLPEFFIDRLCAEGDAVYDPFAGRGTTPVQSALMRRRVLANDINPLSRLLVAPRLAPPALSEVEERLATLPLGGADATAEAPDLLVFYHPETLAQIVALRAYLRRRAEAGVLDRVDAWLRMVALNRLTGHSPGFFSVYTLPPNQAVSVESQRRINRGRAQVPPRREVSALILRKTRSLLRDAVPAPCGDATLLTGAAEATPAIAAASVDLVVTSPPFLDVVDYETDNWLRCWFADVDGSAVNAGCHSGIPAWEAFVRRCFAELARVVRPGGWVAFEVGEVRGGRVRLERHVVAALEGLPFQVCGILVNQQSFTKTAHCWGVGNNTGGTNTNRVVLARRAGLN